MPLLHAAVNVSDIEESIAFYREAFGMEPVNEAEDDGLRQVWVGRGGEADIQLREGEGEPVGPSGVDHVAIGVESVDETAAAFDAEDVEREPTDLDEMGVRIAFVRDPDGYVVELIEPLD